MSKRNKRNKSKTTPIRKQRKTRYPNRVQPRTSSTYALTAPHLESSFADEHAEQMMEQEANARAFEEKIQALAEKRLDELLSEDDDKPAESLSNADLALIKLAHSTFDAQRERTLELIEAEAEAREEGADPHSALNADDAQALEVGKAVMAGDSASAMQLMHQGGEWPEGIDGLQMMAMAAMADAEKERRVAG